MVEDYGTTLEEGARRHLERIQRNVQRMRALIDDLLELARIGRATVVTEQVDLSALAAEVVAELRQAHPERLVRVEIAQRLTAHGDRRLLRIVLVNLIGNAWKYTAGVPTAHITIGRSDGEPQSDMFFVRDNGAGFDMAYADRLFAPFQRLHDASQFEGTGIGLATVQRVIHSHGGRIWANAILEQGATFHFSLPTRLS